MKPISPFDSAPVSAMNFPVSEYVSAFRDAGKMQMAGQQSMMEGINKGISSVTDYLEESRKSQAQANAFKPFFNKATLQNLMGISGDESAAVIEQFKNASTDEKIALGKVLTGTLVEAENQKKQLAARQDEALAAMAVKLGRPITVGGGGGGVIGAQPAESELPTGGGGDLNAPSVLPSLGPVSGAVNKEVIAENEEAKQRQVAFNEAVSGVDNQYKNTIKQISDVQGTTQGDPYAEHQQMQKAKLAEIKALQDKALLYAPVDKKTNETLLKQADDIRNNQPNTLKDFSETPKVKTVFEQNYTKNVKDLGDNLRYLRTMINTAKSQLNENDKSAAIGTIQTFIAQAANSLINPNALGDTERNSVAMELSPLMGKGWFNRLGERITKGDFKLDQIKGTNIADYLKRIDRVSTEIASEYNNALTQRVIKPLGSYAAEQGITTIPLDVKKTEEADGIPEVNQGGGSTPVKNKYRIKNGKIAPVDEPSYNF
jgi:hypothetical protein